MPRSQEAEAYIASLRHNGGQSRVVAEHWADMPSDAFQARLGPFADEMEVWTAEITRELREIKSAVVKPGFKKRVGGIVAWGGVILLGLLESFRQFKGG